MGMACKVGLVVSLSGRWPRELPTQRLAAYSQWAQAEIPGVEWVVAPDIVDSPAMMQAVARDFRQAGVSLVIQVYGAFSGDDLCTTLAETVEAPVILWAPYEPPFDGGRLMANALVSVTMNAASMHRLGQPYHVVYGGYEDARAAGKIKALVNAYRVVEAMKGMLIGLLGYRPTGFYNSAFNEGLIRRTFGIRLEETDLKVVFDRMAQLDEVAVKADMDAVSAHWETSGLPEGHLENHARLHLALKEIMAQQGYAFGCLKCWPEMGALHTTPCAVIGRLMDEGVPVSCEGDLDAALTMVVQNLLTDLPCFITDMINIDEDANTFTFWHCGNAAPSLYHDKHPMTITNHPLAGQGTAFWGTLKEGPVTVARFCDIGGSYKLFLVKGEAVDTEANTRGTMVNVKLDTPVRNLLEGMLAGGVPHHYSLVWQDVAAQMECVAGLLGIEVLHLG